MTAPLPRDDAARALRQELARFLPSDQRDSADGLGDDVVFAAGGLGFDSLRLVELIFALEQRLDVTLPAEILERGPLTLGSLADELRRAAAARA